MAGLALARTGRCLALLTLNVLLLVLTLSALSFTGLSIDVLRRAASPNAPIPKWPLGLIPPASWNPLRTLVAIGLLIIAIAIVRGALRVAAALTQGSLVNAVLTDLRWRVYDKFQEMSFTFFDRQETGSLINRATGDSSGVASFAEAGMIQTTVLAITLVVYFTYMVRLHAVLALLSLATTPLVCISSIIYSRRVRPGYEKNRTLYDKLILSLTENVQGQQVIKGFALEDQQIELFRAANDDYRLQQRWLIRRAAAYGALANFLNLVNMFMVLIVGGFIVVRHHGDPNAPFTVGGLVVFASLVREFSNQIANVANLANTLQVSLTAAGRVHEVLRTPVDIRDAPHALSVQAVQGRIEFHDVCFAYPGNQDVLHDLNFTVEAGQCIAILGATGSGKSTLLSLLGRFYDPSAGRILLDGHDLRDLKLQELRRRIGIVFQESFLFSNTVAANIAFGNPQAGRDQIEKAARIAAAHDFIMELPLGYDTIIGEQGSNLSGGQRQRLALARAILTDPAILILDDATAAIDPETEHEIMSAIEAASAGRTTFIVAHRLSALRRADKVIVIDKGRIAQAGSHEELMGLHGHYANVARMQTADPESLWIIQALRWEAGEVDTPFVTTEELS